MKRPDWGQGMQGIMQNLLMAFMMKKLFPSEPGKKGFPKSPIPESRQLTQIPKGVQSGQLQAMAPSALQNQPYDRQQLMQLIMSLMNFK